MRLPLHRRRPRPGHRMQLQAQRVQDPKKKRLQPHCQSLRHHPSLLAHSENRSSCRPQSSTQDRVPEWAYERLSRTSSGHDHSAVLSTHQLASAEPTCTSRKPVYDELLLLVERHPMKKPASPGTPLVLTEGIGWLSKRETLSRNIIDNTGVTAKAAIRTTEGRWLSETVEFRKARVSPTLRILRRRLAG